MTFWTHGRAFARRSNWGRGMRRRGRSMVFGVLAAVLFPAWAVEAQGASFGCKVLLCATATAPGWSGIPYCVPVMEQLFTDLRKGRGWPPCEEATAGSTSPGISQGCASGTTGNSIPCGQAGK